MIHFCLKNNAKRITPTEITKIRAKEIKKIVFIVSQFTNKAKRITITDNKNTVIEIIPRTFHHNGLFFMFNGIYWLFFPIFNSLLINTHFDECCITHNIMLFHQFLCPYATLTFTPVQNMVLQVDVITTAFLVPYFEIIFETWL